jgi:inorganic pyrophosphatase
VINLWRDLSPGAKAPEEVTAVIEIPSGSRNKYELDKNTGMMKLDRVLYSSVHYPGDYGFIPRTLYEDGDPLDVLVLVKEQTFPGCMIDVRPLGLLRMRDRGESDDKVLAAPLHDPYYEEFFDIADIPRHQLKEVEYFFSTYKALEGKNVEIAGWEKSDVAMHAIAESIRRYDSTYLRVGP